MLRVFGVGDLLDGDVADLDRPRWARLEMRAQRIVAVIAADVVMHERVDAAVGAVVLRHQGFGRDRCIGRTEAVEHDLTRAQLALERSEQNGS